MKLVQELLEAVNRFKLELCRINNETKTGKEKEYKSLCKRQEIKLL